MTQAFGGLSQVLVADVGVDAALVQDDGRAVLVLRPAQTFGSAVRAVQRVVPNMHQDQVRRLVREHLPLAPDLDESSPNAPHVQAALTQRPGLPAGAWVALAVLVALLLAGAVMTGQARTGPAAGCAAT